MQISFQISNPQVFLYLFTINLEPKASLEIVTLYVIKNLTVIRSKTDSSEDGPGLDGGVLAVEL